MEQMISLTIDNRKVETKPGTTVLQAALDADIYIPHLCHHPNLRDVGDCKMCVVEIDGQEGAVTSCTTKAAEGMVIKTKTEKLRHMRNLSMELMLAGHPSECTSCPKYLKCELQNLIQYLGVSDARVRKLPMTHPYITDNPLFIRDMNRCIQCGRCVRACQELRGCEVLDFVRDGEKTFIGSKNGGLLADDNCRFCTACVEVCPTGALMDKPEMLEVFPRVEDSLLPCKASCPAGTDAPRYVRFIKEGKLPEATAVIREKAPFPLTLGYICTAFCEINCRRKEVNKSVAIRELKKYAALNDDGMWKAKSKKLPATGKKTAVIGAGPAGLTAAYYLAKQGHDVTVFEKYPLPGGMMRVGIPEYRLPREVVDGEISVMEEAGVKIKCDTEITSPESLLKDGYDAVLAAFGTHKGVRLPVEGKDQDFVLVNTEFLRDVSLHREVRIGKRVVVLGGGNVAFDCARSARRLGAESVKLACLEDRDHMLANHDEIEEGQEEGIEILNSRTFLKIIDGAEGKGVVCAKVESFHFDENRRLVLKTVPDSEHLLEADTVIFAAGQIVDLPAGFDVTTGRGNTIVVNDYTTSKKGIFAAGDAVIGTSSVIQAIAGGRGAAIAMDKYLGGNGDISEVLAPIEKPNPFIGKEEGFAFRQRVDADLDPVEERVKTFAGCVIPFEDETAHCEAERCLQCDLRIKMDKVKFWGDYTHK